MSDQISTGRKYEKLVDRLIYSYGTVFRNVVMILGHSDKGLEYSAEADMILINSKGIFVFECKSRENWTSRFYSVTDNWILSNDFGDTEVIECPFTQNEKHIAHLKALLGNQTFFNVVVTNLKYEMILEAGYRDSYENSRISTYGDNKILLYADKSTFSLRKFKKYISTLPDVYTKQQIRAIEDILRPISNNYELSQRHERNARLQELIKTDPAAARFR